MCIDGATTQADMVAEKNSNGYDTLNEACFWLLSKHLFSDNYNLLHAHTHCLSGEEKEIERERDFLYNFLMLS